MQEIKTKLFHTWKRNKTVILVIVDAKKKQNFGIFYINIMNFENKYLNLHILAVLFIR